MALMPQVNFHLQVPDKLRYACRLVRRGYQLGTPMRVLAPAGVLQRMDTLLWSLWPAEFIPHCWANAPEAVLRATPIVLADTLEEDAGGPVLLHLGDSIPDGVERYARVMELVSADDVQDQAQARQRWREYKQRGCAMQSLQAPPERGQHT